jgi:uncharacterized membrane protein
VLDQNGAAVANAMVTARNTGTAQSDQQGNYTLSELPPGTYDISVEAPNFSKAVAQGREVNVGRTVTLNFDLKPGQITETVNITADSRQIETTRSDLGGVVNATQVQNLPLLNRTFAALP